MLIESDRKVVDTELEQLAIDPARPLLPLLTRAKAMTPLLVIIAFLPALYAVEHRALTAAAAQQGLLSLDCLAARDLNEFVDAGSTSPDLTGRFQPPLMTWLTALCLRLFGVAHAGGLAAPAYLCTVGLVIAGFVLGRRLGGERLGLVTALLLAFNPAILTSAQEPTVPAAAGFLAILAVAGIVAHWQKGSTATSYQLLLGGIALGLSLLAGGPVAIVIVLIALAYAVWWKSDAIMFRSRSTTLWDKSQLTRRAAIRSVLIFAATGFAVGGWWLLLMGSRHGAEFWRSWLGWNGAVLGAAGPALPTGWQNLALELDAQVLPLVGLALAGLAGIVRELAGPDNDPGRRHRGLVVVWTLVALVAWGLAAFRSDDPQAKLIDLWGVLGTVPLVLLAAVGVLEIADRRLSFPWAVAAALATAWCLAAVTLPRLAMFGAVVSGDQAWELQGLLSALLVASVALVLAHRLALSDRNRRLILDVLLIAIVVGNFAWGTTAVRRAGAADRELDELRSVFGRYTGIHHWMLVNFAAGPATEKSVAVPPAPPPPQLIYVLRSLWPEAALTTVGHWDAVTARLGRSGEEADAPVQLVVTWLPREIGRIAAPANDLRAIGPPFLYRRGEVVGYTTEHAPQMSSASIP